MLHGADGERHGQAQQPRRVRRPCRPSPAGDAAEHVQDPDAAAGGARAPRARRLLPAPPRAQLALGGAPARAGVKRAELAAGNGQPDRSPEEEQDVVAELAGEDDMELKWLSLSSLHFHLQGQERN